MRLFDFNSGSIYDSQGRQVVDLEDGTYGAYFNGWWEGDSTIYELAVQRLFPHSAHGYPLEYFISNDPEFDSHDYGPFCNTCAAAEWINGSDFVVESTDRDLHYGGSYCEECNEPLAIQTCGFCYCGLDTWEYGSLELNFYNDEGMGAHARCISEFVASGIATKVGLLAYNVGLSGVYKAHVAH